MIYKAAPAWSFKGKCKVSASQLSHHPFQNPLLPSPTARKFPQRSPKHLHGSKTSNKFRVGKEIREKNKQQKSPSPASYDPPKAQKNRQMGIIGKEVRGKENRNTSPGPGSYHIPSMKETSSISFASKYEFKNKTLGFPGPGNY